MIERFLEKTEFTDYEDFINNYRLKVPAHFNFGYDVIDEWAKTDPEKEALVWCNDDGEEKRFTFKDISELSNRAANVFRSLGLAKGDFVMLMLKQRPEAWICIVALIKLGVIVIPATFQLTEKDIIYRVNAAKAKMIVCAYDADIVKHINLSVEKCPSLEHVAMVDDEIIPEGFLDFRKLMREAPATLERVMNENDDYMLAYFTSGTNGMPKMAIHTFTYPLGHITTGKYWNCVEDGKLHLTVSDSGWAKFGWGKIFGQWIAGAVMVGYDTEKFNPVKMLETIQRLKITTFCAPPTVYRFLIKEDIFSYDLSSIHHYGIAGEPLNPEVLHRLEDATGLQIHEGFGQTETTVILGYFGGFYPIRPGSMGKPAPLYDIDIVDEEGNSCEDGVVGSIVIRNRPVGLFKEYYNDPEANARAFKNGYYNTGDTAWRDADGYYWFVGRNDDVIKCSGYRIGPFEVESALMTHPSVLECAITAVPDPVRGQVVKATIVLARGYTASEELKKELQNHVKKVTAPYKYPRVVEFVDELPKTVSGKIRRKQIREEDAK